MQYYKVKVYLLFAKQPNINETKLNLNYVKQGTKGEK